MVKVVKAGYEIQLTNEEGLKMVKALELYGRVCYKSDNKITDDSYVNFLQNLLAQNPPHESVIEHAAITVIVTTDRGVTHEWVRHRIASSYSQESTRYCNYGKDKFGGEITVIQPTFELEEDDLEVLRIIEAHYMKCLKEKGRKPQEARYFLPNGLKTMIVCTHNFRQWRHIFRLRTAHAAHPQIREIMIPLLIDFQQLVPVIFDDIEIPEPVEA